ncbi:MAG: porin [Burkholderiaceae bacterium]
MKKNLIALAVFGAFSGAALAQSNVTLYGIIDVNYQYIDPKGSNSATGCIPAPSTGNPQPCSSISGINSGHQSGSRWGIRGSEALSPSLNAVFTLEGGYNPDLGTQGQGGRLFGRQVWAGLSGGWGTLAAGRVATFSSGTGSFDMFGNTDPFSTGFSGLNLAFSSANALRLDNSVLYQSPTWGGFKFGVGHSFNSNGTELPGSGNNQDTTFTGASFTSGPFFVGVTYDRFDIPGVSDNQANLQVGATFDLKFVKLHAGYAKEDNQRVFNVVGITSGADADAWMGGVTIPLLGGSVLASYQRYNGDRVQLTPTTFDERDLKRWGIAYTYPLSRRTNLYASYADNNGEQSINNSATFDARQYTVGLRHLF